MSAIRYPYVYTENMELLSFEELLARLARVRDRGERVVTTNGCFDLLHAGHAAFLHDAKAQGDLLIVGLNGDASVTRLKGAGRPLMPERDRAALLTALRSVDYVLVFAEQLPSSWLAAVRPAIHCKAGDYTDDALPEAEVVRAQGGAVRILPFQAGVSTSALLARIAVPTASGDGECAGAHETGVMPMLLAGSNVLRQTAYRLAARIEQVAAVMTAALQRGNQVLVCGNGESAADARHFAAQLVGRAQRDRPTLSAQALTSNANDAGFASQVAALGRRGDMLVLFASGGDAENLLAAVDVAAQRGMRTLALTGDSPNALAGVCDQVLAIPSREAPLIQQAQIAIIHCLCDQLERALNLGEA